MFTTPIFAKDGRRLCLGAIGEGQALRRNGEWIEGADTGFPSAFRIFRSLLPSDAAGLLLAANTAYFVYLGQTPAVLTPKYVELYCVTIGVGIETAELGLFSSPAPPNKSAQT